MNWLPWSAEAFERAARDDRPVLLSITAAWCAACHEMDRTTYADPGVQAIITDRFVPVRVDSDRRPDINERYNLGGWPTTAFLTPSGDLLAGSTFIPLDQMEGVLRRVADAFQSPERWGARPQAPEGAAGPVPTEEALIEQVFQTYDPEHGGFGVEPKFPLTAPLHLALALARARDDQRWLPVVEHTLDAIAGGGLHDRTSGGYFRYATTRDWQVPHREKLLETNASLLGAFVDAAVTLGRPGDRDRIAELATFIRTSMRLPTGGFAGSDAEPMAYLDSNATTMGALLGAAAVLEDAEIARDALSSFERVLLACYRPGAGVAHYVEGEPRVRGLLVDQVAAMSALLDAFDLTEDEPYRMMAEELAHYVIRTTGADGGAFADRAASPDDLGLLKEAQRPFVANCDAARALRRLERVAGEPEFGARANAALAAAATVASAHGPMAAHYLLAMIEPAAG